MVVWRRRGSVGATTNHLIANIAIRFSMLYTRNFVSVCGDDMLMMALMTMTMAMAVAVAVAMVMVTLVAMVMFDVWWCLIVMAR